MRFTKDWSEFVRPNGDIIWRPILEVVVHGAHELLTVDFLVDSGADVSMAPYDLFRTLGKRWVDGQPTLMRGISRRKICALQGRIHPVDILVPEVGRWFTIPVCFTRGNVPFLLGQQGFFDHFSLHLTDRLERQHSILPPDR